MIRCLVTILATVLASSASASLPTEEKVANGPLHFCGHYFALELAADEKASWRMGPDFDVYALMSQRGGFGIYEGFAPSTPNEGGVTIEVPGFRKVERFKDVDGGISYLIHLPSGRMKYYLHLFGQVWKGDESDLPLISRVKTKPAKIGCDRPTFSNPED
jgi:hypothetical protein